MSRICIIDDGVNPNISKENSFRCLEIIGGKVIMSQKLASMSSHGTLCAKYILKGINKADIISIKILNENETGNVNTLVKALKWCVGKKIDVISISNGYTGIENNELISDLCYELWDCGTLIVAAISNGGKYTIPAHLPYVMGVRRKCISIAKGKYYIGGDIIFNGWSVMGGISNSNSVACARVANRLIKNKDYILNKRSLNIEILELSLLKNKRSMMSLVNDLGKEKSISLDNITLIITDDDIVDYELLDRICSQIYIIVVVSHKCPKRIEKWCERNRVLLWKDSYKISKKKIEYVIPTIWTDDERLATRLKSEFSMREYDVFLVSNNPSVYINDGYCISGNKNIKNAYLWFNPDLLINVSSEDKKLNLFWDVEIYSSQEEYRVIYNGVSHKICSSRIVSEIINILEK